MRHADLFWLEVVFPTNEKRQPSHYKRQKQAQHTTKGGKGLVARLRGGGR